MIISAVTLTAETLPQVDAVVNGYCNRNKVQPVSISVVKDEVFDKDDVKLTKVYIYLLIERNDY